MAKIDLLKVLKNASRTLKAKPTQVFQDKKDDKKTIIKKEIRKWQDEKN